MIFCQIDKDGQEIEDKLQNATDDDLHEWIITFELNTYWNILQNYFKATYLTKGVIPKK